mgnify:CR=1 FL=1
MPVPVSGQKAIVLNKETGVLIDSAENFKYLLFTEYPFNDFRAAQVFEYPNQVYILKIYLKNDSIIDKSITKTELTSILEKISTTENNYQKGDTSKYTILFSDGTIILGEILNFSNEFIELYSPNLGKINIKTNGVVKIHKGGKVGLDANIAEENPHYSRYFYAPSAIPLPKGEGYFQDIYLIFVSGNYAISNSTVIGGGFSILPGIDISEQVFFLNAKVAYPVSEKFYLGGGGLYFGIGDIGGNIGLGYVVGTYGSKNHNLTLGVGYGFTDNKLMEAPVFTLCGMTRISKRISLMTENWFITVSYDEDIPPDYTSTKTVREFHALISYGLRFFGEKLSVDLGFMNVPTSGELFFPGFPYIDFVVRF